MAEVDAYFVADPKGWQREFRSWNGVVGRHLIKVGRAHQLMSIKSAPGPGKRPRNRTGINYATGNLESQIINARSRWGTELEIRTVALPKYAIFVHNGTAGPYVIKPKKPGGLLRFKTASGVPVAVKHVVHPGIARVPFLAENMREALRVA